MYLSPVRLPPFSNREDLFFPVSIFDDDTGQPVNLSGTTGSGTFSSWNVTAGASITTSNTAMTIPVFPIGNQLSALALTVGTGLVINPGDPITISDLSGQNKMQGYVTNYTSTTGALICQIGSTFQFEIRRGPPRGGAGFDYVWYFDFGTINTGGPLLTLSLGSSTNGTIYIVDQGVIQLKIPETSFKKLHLATYICGLTMSDSSDTRQVFIAELPVLYGGVTN
jgi:hypothetical protein